MAAKKHLSILFVISLAATLPAFGQSSLLNSARKSFEAGHLRQAKTEIDTVVTHKRTSQDAESWYYRGLIYGALLRSEEDRFKDISYDAGSEAYASFAKAAELDAPGEKGDPGKYYHLAIDKQKELAMSLLKRGKFFLEKENYLKCMEYLEMVQELYPNNQEAYMLAAEAAIRGKHGNRAKQYYERLKKMGQESPEMYASEVRIAYLLDVNYPHATRLLEEAFSKYPDNVVLMEVAYRFYVADRKYEEAAELLKKLIKKDTENAVYYYEMGDIYNYKRSSIRDTAVANSYFHKAVRVQPDHYDALLALGMNYYEYAEAIDTLPKLTVKKIQVRQREEQVTDDSIAIVSDTLILTDEQIDAALDSIQEVRWRVDSLTRKAYAKARVYLQRAYDVDSKYAILRRNLAISEKQAARKPEAEHRE